MRESKIKLFSIFIIFTLVLSIVHFFVEKFYFEDSAQKIALENGVNKTKEREDLFKNFLEQSKQTLYAINSLQSFQNYIQKKRIRSN